MPLDLSLPGHYFFAKQYFKTYKEIRMKKLMLMLAIVAVANIGCETWNRAMTGSLIGAGAGGVLGGVIGNKLGNTAAGAIIGAAIGGAAGAAIGHYMDKQAEEIQRDIKNAKVERVGEGIKITFNSGILFDVGSDKLQPAAGQNVTQLAIILNKYENTNILVEGHTDSTGTRETNLTLSDNRAVSVARVLKSRGVKGKRITIQGYGPDQPIADNSSVDGRQQNRRVEVAIFANDKLKKAAQENKQL
jgi:outer membrane protein OmpA-like peptidoglycan-associated protein